MSRPIVALAAALGLLSTTACYHAIVETGRPAGSTVVSKPWVNTFIFGLVPAQEINVTQQCPRGVARVETQQTFLNGLVGALTLGIYTPQSAMITCAAGGTSALPTRDLPVVATARDSSLAARAEALDAAARTAARTGTAVLVRF